MLNPLAVAALAKYRLAYLALKTTTNRPGQLRLIADHKAAFIAAARA